MAVGAPYPIRSCLRFREKDMRKVRRSESELCVTPPQEWL